MNLKTAQTFSDQFKLLQDATSANWGGELGDIHVSFGLNRPELNISVSADAVNYPEPPYWTVKTSQFFECLVETFEEAVEVAVEQLHG